VTDELGLVVVDAEWLLLLAALTLVGFLQALAALREVLHCPATLALEGRIDDLRVDVTRVSDDLPTLY
jgi:hypothetical protein